MPKEKEKLLPRVPVDIVCVIDKSGSMNLDNKMNNVKETLKNMLDYLSDHDRVCLIEFGSKGRRITPIRFCTDANIEKVFYPAIEDIEAEGGTSIIDGLIVA